MNGTKLFVNYINKNMKTVLVWLHIDYIRCPLKKESIQLQWANALNRKSLPKQVMVCSEIFLDGKSTERNPIPQLKLGYEKKTTPGENLWDVNPKVKNEKLIKEENSAGIYSSDTVSTSSGHKTEHLPEAICEFNVLEPSSVSAETQYKYSDFLGRDDHTYVKPWTDNQTTFTDKNILHGRKGCSSYDWKRYDVGKRQYSDRLPLFVVYRSKERDIFYFG